MERRNAVRYLIVTAITAVVSKVARADCGTGGTGCWVEQSYCNPPWCGSCPWEEHGIIQCRDGSGGVVVCGCCICV